MACYNHQWVIDMSLKNKILNANPGHGQIAIFYLGQETVLIKHDGRYLLFDPYLSDYVDRNSCTDSVIWKRNYPAPIAPEELDFIDYVFCSHDHGDHTDPVSLSAIAAASPKAVFAGSPQVLAVCTGCGIPAERTLLLRADETVPLADGLSVTAIPAAHEELHPCGDGCYAELGFILDLNGVRVYHAGDCCMYDGLIARIRNVDVAFLPINGRDYFRTSNGIIGNFDSTEAIQLASQANVSLLIPLHYDLYDINCVNPAYFVDCLQKTAPNQRFHLFVPGEKFIFEK